MKMVETHIYNGRKFMTCEDCGSHIRVDDLMECDECGAWYELTIVQKVPGASP